MGNMSCTDFLNGFTYDKNMNLWVDREHGKYYNPDTNRYDDICNFKSVQIKPVKHLSAEDLDELFHSVGWELDTPSNVLQAAMMNSSHILTAWEGEKLIGLIRSMDDGCWSANIDCLVVHKNYQHRGIGGKLLMALLNMLSNVMIINVRPNESINFNFYEKYGFIQIKDGGLLQKYNMG